MKLVEFVKLVKEVKAYNNNNISHYVAVEIAKLIKNNNIGVNTMHTQEQEDLLLKSISEFWEWNHKAKQRSNETKIREANQQKIRLAEKIVNQINNTPSLNDVFEKETHKYADFIRKWATAYIPVINGFGKLASYVKFGD
jgi:hypothetical protein